MIGASRIGDDLGAPRKKSPARMPGLGRTNDEKVWVGRSPHTSEIILLQ